jgi:hypothetical protein
MTSRLFVVFAVLAVLAGGLAACSSAGGKDSPGASPSASANAQRTLEIGRQFAQCARDHGYPNFPDPVIANGRLSFSNAPAQIKDESRAVERIPECKAILDQLPPPDNYNPTPSAADMQKLRDFAKCVRDHGITGWPDPKADGTFPIVGTPLESEGKSERFLAAVDACKQYWDRGVSFS